MLSTAVVVSILLGVLWPTVIAPTRRSAQLTELLAQAGATLPERLPSAAAAKVALGEALYWDPLLGGNKDMACVTCHHPLLGTGDGLSLSIGVGGQGLAPERAFVSERQVLVPRNAPPVFNLGLAGMDTMFWDGRIQQTTPTEFLNPADDYLPSGLENAVAVQAMFPVTSRDEMRGQHGDYAVDGQPNMLANLGDHDMTQMWATLIQEILALPTYQPLFRAAYPNTPLAELGFADAANAIAAYEMETFTFLDSPWDRYLQGEENALSHEALKGATLFYGEAGCAQCHSGSLLTDMQFHNIGVPQVGPGKGEEAPLDYGRSRETEDENDLFAFRTPPLRNVSITGPWMHNGVYLTLEEAVRHHLNPAQMVGNYDYSQLSDLMQADDWAGTAVRTAALSAPSFAMPQRNLSDADVAAILAFLDSLTSPTARDLSFTIPDSVPSGLPVGGAIQAEAVPIVATEEQMDAPQTNILTDEDSLSASVGVAPFSVAPSCNGEFVTHWLDHVTDVQGEVVRMFETNGAGVAINDLDQDGWLDIVFANLNGPATIFWNRGDLTFAKETLPDLNTRAVNIVDVTGDGRLDIVFTHIVSSLTYWENVGVAGNGRTTFTRLPLPGVRALAHSMAWGDLNGDGSLDLVTGSYDAELNLNLGNTFLFSDGEGVYQYMQSSGAFTATRLANASQALVIALLDVNQDGQRDILVGNDFSIPDMTWLQQNGTWQPASPFPTTAKHTMNFDWGDINNDGTFELFATDMTPYETDEIGLAPWMIMMETMAPEPMAAGDPQITSNVLLMQNEAGTYQNRAVMSGVHASGWAWSGKFGDLNQDGFLDLYVVNGMIDAEMFDYLPGNELVEENQAYQNVGGNFFTPTPDWQLGSNESGRGMSLADLDNDGDLDIVVNNLRSQAQLFENQLCRGASLEVDLRWPASPNPFALGSTLILHTSTGTYTRDVRANSGYLSGDATRVHFGFPAEAELNALEIIWPDGEVTIINDLAANTLLGVERP
ncbi:MAG: VCBS repeat-containing protein [Ardenticatenaceae bacterium]|nr:VCBS repeat-containing protein [Ardenticatenaceae bacterium]